MNTHRTNTGVVVPPRSELLGFAEQSGLMFKVVMVKKWKWCGGYSEPRQILLRNCNRYSGLMNIIGHDGALGLLRAKVSINIYWQVC